MVPPATASSASSSRTTVDQPGGSSAAANRRSGGRRAKKALRRFVYGVYFFMPPRLRRRVVRLAMARYTVGAVALVWDTEQPERLLLIRHPRAVGWSLPAGLLGRGERPVDGCARELTEESGLRLRPEDFTPAVPNAVVHTRGMWVDTVFEARVPASTATLEVDGAEVVEAGWHRLDSLPPISVATARLLAHYGIGPYAAFPEARG
jgi:ADP-ribose pyrophosphatase YjhB (NUDIX family)